MTTKEAVALLERYSNYDGMGIPNLAGCKEAMRVAVDALKEAYPELEESEDERVRRELIEFIQWSVDRHFMRKDFHQAKRPSEWIAYLKKQKYNRMQPVYDNQESFESALDKAWKSYNDCGSRRVDSFEDDYIECAHAKGFREGYLFGIEKQKEQKEIPLMGGDTDTYFDDLRITTKPLTSREWFDEGIKYAQRLQKEQKPAEWSEEDEKIRARLYEYFQELLKRNEDCYKYGGYVRWEDLDVKSIIAWLKSLRPKSHWKPSEGQMSMLLAVINDPNNAGAESCQLALRVLYQDLKKLM